MLTYLPALVLCLLQLRVQYSLYLKKTRVLHKLLLHLFRLMPENPALPGQPTEMASKEPKSFFTESLSLSLGREYKNCFHARHVTSLLLPQEVTKQVFGAN